MKASSVDRVILDLLGQTHTHLNAQEIYQQIRQRLPAVNRSTVYRSLERLAHAGVVSISDLGTGAVVYEAVTDNSHHHLVCQCCGKVTLLDPEEVEMFFKHVETANQFHILTNHLVLFGLCRECQGTQ